MSPFGTLTLGQVSHQLSASFNLTHLEILKSRCHLALNAPSLTGRVSSFGAVKAIIWKQGKAMIFLHYIT